MTDNPHPRCIDLEAIFRAARNLTACPRCRHGRHLVAPENLRQSWHLVATHAPDCPDWHAHQQPHPRWSDGMRPAQVHPKPKASPGKYDKKESQ